MNFSWRNQFPQVWLAYVLIILFVSMIAQLTPTNDAAWQIWIGRQLSSGANLYEDIIEINPPLWFWVAVPIVKLSDVFGISGFTCLMISIGASAAFSIFLVHRLNPSAWIGLVLVVAFFATGISASGQREQFTLIAFTPYVFLAAARAESKSVPVHLAATIGLFAGTGIALKPYFVLAPFSLEIWLLIKRRGGIRTELIAIGAAGLAYFAAILLLAPDYVRLVVPLVSAAYGSLNPPFQTLLSSEIVSVGALAVLGFALLPQRSSTVQALLIAGMAFLFAFLIQQKGFRYHGVPAIGLFSAMAITAIAGQVRWDIRGKCAAFTLAIAPVVAVATTFNQGTREHQPTRALLCGLAPGSPVLVLTPYGDVAWPLIETCRLRWSSRHMFLWMLHAINREPSLHERTATSVRAEIAEDIARYEPTRILIPRGPDRFGMDPLMFTLSSPIIRSQLVRNYDKSVTDEFVVYDRRSANLHRVPKK